MSFSLSGEICPVGLAEVDVVLLVTFHRFDVRLEGDCDGDVVGVEGSCGFPAGILRCTAGPCPGRLRVT